MYDLIIVGGGAASQSAAMYAIGKQLNFLMIYEKLGGRVDHVESADRDYLVGNIVVHFDFPDAEEEEDHLIGSSAVHLFERQIKTQTGRVINDLVTNITRVDNVFHVTTKQHGVQESATVLIATGAKPNKVSVPGAGELLIGDLGYSVTTHARQVADRSVGVIGMTEQSLYSAAELAQTAARVYVVTPDASLMTTSIGRVLLEHPKIEVLEGYQLIRVIGGFKIEGLEIERAGQKRRIDVDMAFVDMGQQPRTSLVQQFGVTDERGFIRVDQNNATEVPGLYAAGDVTQSLGDQVLIAIGDGARAAVSAHHYLLTHAGMKRVGS